MKRTVGTIALGALFAVAALTALGLLDRYLAENMLRTGYFARLALVALFCLLVGAFFARERIRTWFRPGKLRIDGAALAVAAVSALSMVPCVPLIGGAFARNEFVVLLLFWTGLLRGFRREG